MPEIRAEIRLPTSNLSEDIAFFLKTLKMRMDLIYPADDPRVAVFSGHGIRLLIDADAEESPGTLRLRMDNPDGFAAGERVLVAPNGTRVEIEELNPPLIVPPTEHSFVVHRLRDSAPWVIGRAGMQYRDLIPSRLGGSIIASHIRIPDGGPVPDMVHFHKVGFQLIFCYRGWVSVVYEDQGPPITLTAGDCFIQPPEIRHRVLEASDNVEVIEIGVPADHITEIDHEMELPTPDLRPEREWQGQRFVFNEVKTATWQPFRIPGFDCRDTTINANTKGIAGVQVAKRKPGQDILWTCHDTDILFTFVLEGNLTLEGEGRDPYPLEAGDAFVVPPNYRTCFSEVSDNVELLEVSLPGEFSTIFG